MAYIPKTLQLTPKKSWWINRNESFYVGNTFPCRRIYQNYFLSNRKRVVPTWNWELSWITRSWFLETLFWIFGVLSTVSQVAFSPITLERRQASLNYRPEERYAVLDLGVNCPFKSKKKTVTVPSTVGTLPQASKQIGCILKVFLHFVCESH